MLIAAKMVFKNQVDNKIVLAATEIVDMANEVIETSSVAKVDTIYVTVTKTRIVYVAPPRKEPNAYFSDTSSISIPENSFGVRFRDSLVNIALTEWIKPPKTFIYQDTNIYLAGTVLTTGVFIDSVSVPAKLIFNSRWDKNVAEVGLMSANPFITGLKPLVFKTKRPFWFSF